MLTLLFKEQGRILILHVRIPADVGVLLLKFGYLADGCETLVSFGLRSLLMQNF